MLYPCVWTSNAGRIVMNLKPSTDFVIRGNAPHEAQNLSQTSQAIVQPSIVTQHLVWFRYAIAALLYAVCISIIYQCVLFTKANGVHLPCFFGIFFLILNSLSLFRVSNCLSDIQQFSSDEEDPVEHNRCLLALPSPSYIEEFRRPTW